jgi:hypothetical protein
MIQMRADRDAEAMRLLPFRLGHLLISANDVVRVADRDADQGARSRQYRSGVSVNRRRGKPGYRRDTA